MSLTAALVASSVVAVLSLAIGTAAAAQGSGARSGAPVNGSMSLLFDVLPDVGAAEGRQHVSEARARVLVETRRDVGDHWRVNLAAYVDGLVADRDATGAPGTTTDAVVGPLDLYAEFVASRVEVRAGASRLTWGRLDEFQPTDVVNPIDLTRFLLEGRSEARLAVGLVRTRLFLTKAATIEAVIVPAFRRSRFDQLDESSSPFNLFRTEPPVPDVPTGGRVRLEPDVAWGNVQGGLRLTSTVGRFDWGMSSYRGFRTFPIVSLRPAEDGNPVAEAETAAAVAGYGLIESYPRFTMIGGDFETVRGAWGVRGELAVFADDELQSTRAARGVAGHSIEGGAGVDRRAGDYRVAANVLWSWRAIDPSDTYAPALDGDPELERTDFSIIMAADRSFARETRTLRIFAVYDPGDATAFARAIAAVSLRDNLWLEGSAGLFAGDAPDTIGRLTRRDFVYARLKVFF